MSISNKRLYKLKYIVLTLAILPILTLFQNCGEFQVQNDSSSSELSSETQINQEKLYIEVGDMIVHRSSIHKDDLQKFWPEHWEDIQQNGSQKIIASGLTANTGDLKLWPGGLIPVSFPESLSNSNRNLRRYKCSDFNSFSSVLCI